MRGHALLNFEILNGEISSAGPGNRGNLRFDHAGPGNRQHERQVSMRMVSWCAASHHSHGQFHKRRIYIQTCRRQSNSYHATAVRASTIEEQVGKHGAYEKQIYWMLVRSTPGANATMILTPFLLSCFIIANPHFKL